MMWLFRLLSLLLSTLAIAALARRAYDTGSLSAPLALVMDTYNATMRLLLGWAEPYLRTVLAWLGLAVNPIWRDATVLAVVWMGGMYRGHSRRGFLRREIRILTVITPCLTAFLTAGAPQMPLANYYAPAMTVVMLVAASVMLLYGWRDERWRFSLWPTGLNILGGFFGAALFFAVDAGLKLLL